VQTSDLPRLLPSTGCERQKPRHQLPSGGRYVKVQSTQGIIRPLLWISPQPDYSFRSFAISANGVSGMSDLEHVAIGNRAGRQQRS